MVLTLVSTAIWLGAAVLSPEDIEDLKELAIEFETNSGGFDTTVMLGAGGVGDLSTWIPGIESQVGASSVATNLWIERSTWSGSFRFLGFAVTDYVEAYLKDDKQAADSLSDYYKGR